jgi:hypothetical protein
MATNLLRVCTCLAIIVYSKDGPTTVDAVADAPDKKNLV